MTTDPTATRRDRYAAALSAAGGHDWTTILDYPKDVADYRAAADAVMDIADAEHDAKLNGLTAQAIHIVAAVDALSEENARLRAHLEAAGKVLTTTSDRLGDAESELKQQPADRAAVLREAADIADEEARHLYNDMGQRAAAGARLVGARLRRLADEAQQAESEPQPDAPTSDRFCTFGVTDVPGSGCVLLAGHEPANRHVVTDGDLDEEPQP